METILTIISSLLGCSTLVGFILYGKANRRIKDAEAQEAKAKAEKAEADADEAEDHRFDNLLKLVDSLTTRLSTLNATVDKHIDRNRELADRLYKSERELNLLNEKLLKVTEERDREKLLKEKYKEWHCRSSVCMEDKPDPKGRRPPNPKIVGKEFTEAD